MARILIAGSGDIGTELGVRLASDGHEVFGLRRDPPKKTPEVEGAAGGFWWLTADLTQPKTLAGLPGDLDYAVYTASADARSDIAYRRAYVMGLRNTIQMVKRTSPRLVRFFYTSSTAVYGQEDGSRVNELSPTEPQHFSGKRVLEGERLLAGSELPHTIIRLGGIYGPNRTRLVDEVKRGEAVCFKGERYWTNRIHRDDCVGAVHHLMNLPGPAELYLAVDDEPADRCTVLAWIARRLGLPAPRVAGPGESAPKRTGGNKRCSNRLLKAAGYRFEYRTFREGYAAILDAELAAGS